MGVCLLDHFCKSRYREVCTQAKIKFCNFIMLSNFSYFPVSFLQGIFFLTGLLQAIDLCLDLLFAVGEPTKTPTSKVSKSEFDQIKNDQFVEQSENIADETTHYNEFIVIPETSSHPEESLLLNISCNELITEEIRSSAASIQPEAEIVTNISNPETRKHLSKINSVQTEEAERPNDKFCINGKEINMYIDSGSPASFLKTKEWKRIGKPPITYFRSIFCTTMGGRFVKITGAFVANVLYEKEKYLLPIFVGHGISINIVGRNWLSRFRNVDWNMKFFPERFEKIPQEEIFPEDFEEIPQETLDEIKRDTFYKCPKINLDINGIIVTANLNTEFSRTMISKKTWERIGKPKLKRTNIYLEDEASKKISFVGKCFVKISQHLFEIIVLEESNPADQLNYIGMDVIKYLELDLDQVFRNLI